MSKHDPYGHKFEQFDVIGYQECPCCDCEGEIKLDKNLRAYFVCLNLIDKPLQELTRAQRSKRIVGKVKCNRKIWFSFPETAALKMDYLRHIKENRNEPT